jgi:hypothetical protein
MLLITIESLAIGHVRYTIAKTSGTAIAIHLKRSKHRMCPFFPPSIQQHNEATRTIENPQTSNSG